MITELILSAAMAFTSPEPVQLDIVQADNSYSESLVAKNKKGVRIAKNKKGVRIAKNKKGVRIAKNKKGVRI